MKQRDFLKNFFNSYFQPHITSLFFAGFSSGFPFLLTLAILDIWLKESNISNSVIGLISFLHWPFMFKFLWGPFIESLDLPVLSKSLGRRRSWAIVSQFLLILSLIGMGFSSPETHLIRLLCFASLASFAGGCQDIAMYSYQLDHANKNTIGPIAGIVLLGYRIGMLLSKSGSLYLAAYYNWKIAYIVMGALISISVIYVLTADEPDDNSKKLTFKGNKTSIANLKQIFKVSLTEPFKNFCKTQNWKQCIALVILFRAGDSLIQKMDKLFYIELGFSKIEIANVVQIFGMIPTMIGGLIGGILIKTTGLYKSMLISSILHCLSNFCYILLCQFGHNVYLLYFTVAIENFTGGAMGTTFIAFLYHICRESKYATQYALLWGIFDIGSSVFRMSSGILVDTLGWYTFFAFVPLAYIPAISILRKIIKHEKLS